MPFITRCIFGDFIYYYLGTLFMGIPIPQIKIVWDFYKKLYKN